MSSDNAPRGAHRTRRQVLLGTGAAALLAACSGPAAAPAQPAPATRTSARSSTPTSPAAPTSTPAPSPTPAPTPPPPTTTTQPPADAATILGRSHVPILCYHQIRDWTGDDSTSARPYIMPPATFTAQLDALAGSGFRTISPDQLTDHLVHGAPLPPKPVLLSFDDSDLDGFTVAAPAMAQRGFVGTFFIMTVVLDKKYYMSADQIRQLDAAGHTIGAHTWDHHRVDKYSGKDWRIQLDEPGREIAKIVGHPIRYFAYPYGAWNPAALPYLTEAGYTAAFKLNGKPVDPQQPLLTIQRAIANPYWSTDTLLQTVATGF